MDQLVQVPHLADTETKALGEILVQDHPAGKEGMRRRRGHMVHHHL